jgi:hypothetical protein
VWYAAADAHAILVVSLRKVGLGTLWSNWWTTLFRQQKRVEGGAHDGAGSRASVGSTCQSKREENVLEEREDANDIFSHSVQNACPQCISWRHMHCTKVSVRNAQCICMPFCMSCGAQPKNHFLHDQLQPFANPSKLS